jgi:predicted ATPase
MVEARFPELCATQPELLAHHYTEAGRSAQAIPYWQRAGQRAMQRSAYVEAVAHLTRGLALLSTFPGTPECLQQELDMQITLGPALMATKGQASPEVEHAYARARELCQQVGETPQLFSVLGGLHRFYFARGALQTARELGEQHLRLAQTHDDRALLLTSHWMLGTPLFWLGEVASAHEHFVQSITLYDPQQHRILGLRYGLDPGAASQVYAAMTLWALGYPDQALQRCQEALPLAQPHPFSLAYTLLITACLYQFLRQDQAVYERAEAAVILSTEQGFPIWVPFGRTLQGWALAMQGQRVQGIALMRQGMAAWQAIGVALLRPWILAMLAEAYGAEGQASEGLRELAEASAIVNSTAERFWEAELYRLTGELRLKQPVPDAQEAETCFCQALAVARRQQAKSLELRAARSLSRLWQQQGKRAQAYALLAPTYGWFTEGFDTADLQEAKALLAELG